MQQQEPIGLLEDGVEIVRMGRAASPNGPVSTLPTRPMHSLNSTLSGVQLRLCQIRLSTDYL